MNAQACLELHDLSLRFGGMYAVRDVNLRVAHGERHAVLGPNGAGKTSLFNLIAGDLTPNNGTITLLGADATRWTPQRRARTGLARTYQRSLLFDSLTARDHLYLAIRGTQPNRLSLRHPGNDTEASARIRDVASQLDIADHLDTPVGTFPHGLRRQLDIAMAIASQPKLLLLDEPAAGLSQSERDRLVAILEALPRTIAMMIVEHDMDVALRIADRVTVMADGTRIATGAPDEIRRDLNVQAVYLGTHHA
jgi:branched-chain amino acid transport system ATP-binding protein